MNDTLLALGPTIAFLAISIALAAWMRARSRTSGAGFATEYFIANRSLGGFVLAMTTVATYGSVSSFVGGPGQAWQVGFGWVYMAAVQTTALFLLYGIMGKKLALVSRRIGAVTVVDVIRARYRSDALANLSAAVIVCFFVAMMVAQFVGGAKIFEAVTGQSYVAGLALFGVAVVVYTTVGGFRGVAATDALCGVAMLVCIVVLAAGLLAAGGGWEAVMERIGHDSPELFDPLAGGQMPLGLYATQWMLVGIFTFALPQSVVRCMGFRDERALRRALVVGTIVIGVMMIAVTALGVLARGVLDGPLSAYGGSVDNIIPAAIVQSLPPALAGVAIIGPLAASISTVSSLLISASSSIVKDVWMHRREASGRPVLEKAVARRSQLFTLGVGVLVFVLAIVPPDLIWKMNMFAFGGLETAFCWVLVAGLYWRRASKWGALLSMAGGVLVYCALMAAGIKPFGLHQIATAMPISLALMVIGSLAGPKDEPDGAFFPARTDGAGGEEGGVRGKDSAYGKDGVHGENNDPDKDDALDEGNDPDKGGDACDGSSGHDESVGVHGEDGSARRNRV